MILRASPYGYYAWFDMDRQNSPAEHEIFLGSPQSIRNTVSARPSFELNARFRRTQRVKWTVANPPNPEIQTETLPSSRSVGSQSEVRSDLLSVTCRSVTRLVGFLFANISSVVGVAIPPLPFEMINTARKVKPNDCILRAMLLSLFLGTKESQTAGGRAVPCIVLAHSIGQRRIRAKQRKQQNDYGQRQPETAPESKPAGCVGHVPSRTTRIVEFTSKRRVKSGILKRQWVAGVCCADAPLT
jgi:hypothetical protein